MWREKSQVSVAACVFYLECGGGVSHTHIVKLTFPEVQCAQSFLTPMNCILKLVFRPLQGKDPQENCRVVLFPSRG